MLIIQSIIVKLSTLMALHVSVLFNVQMLASNNTIVYSVFTADYSN